jgi:hypothetical protein
VSTVGVQYSEYSEYDTYGGWMDGWMWVDVGGWAGGWMWLDVGGWMWVGVKVYGWMVSGEYMCRAYVWPVHDQCMTSEFC